MGDGQSGLQQLAKRLEKSVSQSREDPVIDNDQKETGRSALPPTVISDDYHKALRLKEEMMENFEGCGLEDVLPGGVYEGGGGRCYCVREVVESALQVPDGRISRDEILSSLFLLKGVGGVRQRVLREEGYLSIKDLVGHPEWGEQAEDFLSLFQSGDLGCLQEWLWRWLPKSHRLVHRLSGLVDREDLLFFDVETLGFGGLVVVLGVAREQDGGMCVDQFLVREAGEEPAALSAFREAMRDCEAVVTFNGRSFDMPYVRDRLAFYGMQGCPSCAHFGLLHFVRRAWGKRVPNCRLNTIESFLGLERKQNLPSGLVPDFYTAYRKTDNVGPLVPVVKHNFQDLLTLCTVFSRLGEDLYE